MRLVQGRIPDQWVRGGWMLLGWMLGSLLGDFIGETRVVVAEEFFRESVIQPVPASQDAAIQPTGNTCITDTCNSCNVCGNQSCAPSAYYLFADLGTSYFDTTDSALGFAYGAHLFVPFDDGLFAYGSVSANHYDDGTQLYQSLGLYRKGVFGDCPGDRLGAIFIIDQYTDTAYGSPYLAQARYGLSYVLSRSVQVGFTYTDPLHGSLAALPIFGGAAFFTAPARPVENIQFYLDTGGLWLSGGYIEELDSGTFSLGLRPEISDRAFVKFQLTYDEQPSIWSAYVGLELNLTPGERHQETVRGGLPGAVAAALLGGFTLASGATLYQFDPGFRNQVNQVPNNVQHWGNDQMRALQNWFERCKRNPYQCGKL